jgi:hypothetical protein
MRAAAYRAAEEILDELMVYLDQASAVLDLAPQALEGVGSPLGAASHELDKALERARRLCDGLPEGAAQELSALIDQALLALQAAAQSRARNYFHGALGRCRQLLSQARQAAADWYQDLPAPLERDELW